MQIGGKHPWSRRIRSSRTNGETRQGQRWQGKYSPCQRPHSSSSILLICVYITYLQVSFDDFEAVFAQEREEIKKEKAENLCSEAVSSAYHGSESTEDSLSLQQNNTLERLSTIREIPVSPASSTPFKDDLRADNSVDEGSSVILRHKVIRRATLPARLDSPESFSPIHTERRRRSPASELPGTLNKFIYR